MCNGCRTECPSRALEVDQVIPQRAGGQETSRTCSYCTPIATWSKGIGRTGVIDGRVAGVGDRGLNASSLEGSRNEFDRFVVGSGCIV